MSPERAKQRAREIEKEVLSKNGIVRDFTNKEVYLLLLDNIDKKLDAHLRHSEETLNKYIPLVNKQTEILDHIMKELPDKGFCGKMEQMYNDLYTSEDTHTTLVKKVGRVCQDLYPADDISVPQKVDQMWEGYKLIKYLVGLTVAAMIGTFLNLFVHF